VPKKTKSGKNVAMLGQVVDYSGISRRIEGPGTYEIERFGDEWWVLFLAESGERCTVRGFERMDERDPREVAADYAGWANRQAGVAL
jgi:hypothetical protein